MNIRRLVSRAPRLARWAPLLLAGPVTGPLIGLLIAAVRAKRPVAATLAAAGLLAVNVGAPALLVHLAHGVA